MLLIGVLMFDIPTDVNYPILLVVITLGCVAFLGLGMLIAVLSPSVTAFNGIISFVQIPLVLLGGVFFSVRSFPEWLQSFARLMPLTQLNTAMRELLFNSVGFHNIARLTTEIAGLGAWCVLTLVLARLRFRW
jgi:ABC-type polysaccharide/polyol phosphate export permease